MCTVVRASVYCGLGPGFPSSTETEPNRVQLMGPLISLRNTNSFSARAVTMIKAGNLLLLSAAPYHCYLNPHCLPAKYICFPSILSTSPCRKLGSISHISTATSPSAYRSYPQYIQVPESLSSTSLPSCQTQWPPLPTSNILAMPQAITTRRPTVPACSVK